MNGNRNNNVRGRRPNPNGPSLRQSMGLLKSSLHGHPNKLRGTNPPSYTRVPYNNLIVNLETFAGQTDPGVGKIDASDLIGQLEDQLFGTQSVTGLRVKVQRIDLWALPEKLGDGGLSSVGINPEISAKFYSIIDTSVETSGSGALAETAALKELDDIGLAGQSAAIVSYSWPRNQQDIPIRLFSEGTYSPIAEWATPTGVRVVARVHVHWSSVGATTLSQRYVREAQ